MPPAQIRKALVIDDEPVARAAAMVQLRAAGIKDVHSAPDWDAARAMLYRDKAFDLVVTDLDMPGATGDAFLEDLARTAPGVAVLIVSALDPVVLKVTRKQAAKAGLRLLGVLEKPLSAEKLGSLLSG